MTVTMGLPSKGRLQQDVFNWFSARGIEIVRAQSDREYAARIEGFAGVKPVFLSAGEIPKALADGKIDLGVTGTDLVAEKTPNAKLTRVTQLGLGFADLIVAVPSCWVDVDTIDDLDAVAAQFRRDHGMRLRIATKYHFLVRKFLSARGVADYQLVDSQGATEATVKNQTSEAIADITSTGSTLAANHLKVLSDGLVLKSQAELFLGPKARSKAAQLVVESLSQKLG
jgi:ATP phosphoribosyltransferase